jgi:hypothetical protein
MARTKQEDEAAGMMASRRLPGRYAFAVGARVAGPGIAGEVLTQDGPWTVTLQQDRGGRIGQAEARRIAQVTARAPTEAVQTK